MKIEDINAVIKEIAPPYRQETLKNEKEVDFSYGIKGVGRFRVNIYQEKNGPAIAFRVIPYLIPSFEEIGLGDIAKTIASLPRGLILVTGPTGSGKSTTLATMIDYINFHRQCHIITVEDPIEFIYDHKKSMVTQREINSHTLSFGKAIKSALRQDPDVVLVGEMRDLETISAAITLAETGHLVLSTLHTIDAAQTVDRIIDVFPPNQQQQIRMQLAMSLKAVISQTLVPIKDGVGRVAAREIMLNNDGIRNCIMKGETYQIYSMIEIAKNEGMQLLDDSLFDLYQAGKISKESMLAKATDASELNNRIEE